MDQLTQKLKDGQMQVLEVPEPALPDGNLLIQNMYSLVSAGTEGSTVKAARSSLIEKAKQRPQQVKQVIDTLKSQGPVQTYRAVMKQLDAYSPLGYSCVGKVKGIGSKVKGFQEGDLVACGGLTACHAEVVSVPQNLCGNLQPDTDLKQATYNTLGAIAMQGVRQADLRLGETCAVIGLGLLGQLACLLLRVSGVRVIGIDIDAVMVEIAAKHCADLALTRNDEGIDGKINEFSGRIGCDAVIIAAGTDSLDPINFAGAVARKKGTVVVVGAVPTGFDREPHYYKKELQVKMSCSYGPGRYDPQYEEKGLDYSPAHVRWTEKRNMEAFQELIYSKKIDVSYLTTHTFKLEDAPKAYDMILEKTEPYLGLLIEYDITKEPDLKKSKITIKPPTSIIKPSRVSIGFIGAGSYAQSHLIPNLQTGDDLVLKGVMTATGTGSRSVGERFGFEFCTGDETDIIENSGINTVFIATRHDSHADYVLKALNAGKNVFVEKPLCLNPKEFGQVYQKLNSKTVNLSSRLKEDEAPAYDTDQPIDDNSIRPILMVGYNRRFSPFAQMIKGTLGSGSIAMTYRVNAGAIPPDHWIQDQDFGGGRIIGEVCHFVDFLTYISGSLPALVHADVLKDPNALNDSLTVSLKYVNGSIGAISYFANGAKSLSKERVEVYAHGCTAVIDDFKSMTLHSGGKKTNKKLMSQDKGQKNEIRVFIDAVRGGAEPPIPYDELFSTSLVTFKILDSIRTGQSLKI
ncbi:Sorbitol dehydrogenase (EC [Olavius sp. associated proteobacterium Delta 1]|nr:Sorbitol dehydrogenase (EC [Olavius sp. associated proteobacterium Delta 1]